MNIDKIEILEKHCYTELVYQRINKKLKIDFSKDEIQKLIKQILQETVIESYIKKGKNFYISNEEKNIRITVNSNTFRIITVDKIRK
ncbi:MAG: DUF3781 domain-containing protein [Polaribacter sp.]|uniref:DUF3781 domain-containing protein n=1 Tax=Polaribacter sp. TaxID=1920175 RepID=UPI003265A1B7